MMQKMQCIISKEHNDRPITMRRQIKRIREECGNDIVACQEGHQDELNDVDKDIHRKEGANPDVKAVTKF